MLSFFFFSTIILCVQNQITQNSQLWLKWNSSPLSLKNHYGTRKKFHPNNTIAGREGSSLCHFQDDDNILYVFGGLSYQACGWYVRHNDLWSYNVELNQWAWIAGNNSCTPTANYSIHGYPGPRWYPSISCVDNKILLIGGENGDGILNDVWSYSLNNDEWEWLRGSENVDTPTEYGTLGDWNVSMIGGLKLFFVLDYVDITLFGKNNPIVIFGGKSFTPYHLGFNQVWIYSEEENDFMWLWGESTCDVIPSYGHRYAFNVTNIIGGRYGSSGWRISEKEFFVFGGRGHSVSSYGDLNDLWIFNFDLLVWKWLEGGETSDDYYTNRYGKMGETLEPGKMVNGRSLFASFYHNGNIYVIGGFTQVHFASLNDVVMYSLADREWKLVFGTATIDRSPTFFSNDYSTKNKFHGVYSHVGMISEDENGNPIITLFGGFAKTLVSYDYVNTLSSFRHIFNCFGKNEYEHNVCGGNGKCVNFDTCECDDGMYGLECSISYCNGLYSNNSLVCNQKGLCEKSKCRCLSNFVGQNCNIPKCNGKMKNSSNVCSSRGVCQDDNICGCNMGWYGDYCEIRNPLFVVVEYWYFPLIVVTLLLFLCVLIICIVIFTGVIIFKQGKTVKKIEEIGDIDILLEERKLEKDLSIAHLKINKKLFEINFEKDVKLLEIIGRGGSECDVFLVEWKGQKAAFKSFRRSNLFVETQENFEEFEREVEILASVSHPNILRFYGAVLSTKQIGYLMEYAKEGELGSFLLRFSKKNGFKYPISEKIRLLTEISQGMNHIHELNIIHRDLKPENVLIMDKTLTAKIMDFGGSKIVQNEDNENTRRVGTSYYMSPEVFSGTNYNSKCDVYSFGILMFVVFSEKLSPFGMNSNDVELKVSKDKTFRPKIEKESFKGVSKGIISLMKQCWDHDSDKRPTFERILKVLKKEKESMRELKVTKSVSIKDLKIVFERNKKLIQKIKKENEIWLEKEKDIKSK